MYPWLWFWAPDVHLPWSGNVAQQIEPNTNWFFDSIPPQAGNGRIERKAFGVASYGKQLGLVIEVLLELAEQAKPMSERGADAVRELKRIQAEIEKIKAAEYDAEVVSLETQVKALKGHAGTNFAKLSSKLRPLLDEGDA